MGEHMHSMSFLFLMGSTKLTLFKIQPSGLIFFVINTHAFKCMNSFILQKLKNTIYSQKLLAKQKIKLSEEQIGWLLHVRSTLFAFSIHLNPCTHTMPVRSGR